ncbi:unnamed protein product [Malus baccata var. baccata]
MAIKLLVALLCVLFSTAATQPCYPPYPQELINSMGPTLSPSSSSFPPTPTASIESNPTTPVVPALFVIGDSSVDCGTNNFLGTFARADRLPYGRDFDTHQPTGRFCNGRIPVDYHALRLGLPFVPSYLGQNGRVEEMIQGLNFASACAGIIFTSGSELGQHVSFSQQWLWVLSKRQMEHDASSLCLCKKGEVDSFFCCNLNLVFTLTNGPRHNTNHVWWDQFHPTDAVNAILADNVWNGLHTKMCYPINLRDMVVSSSY